MQSCIFGCADSIRYASIHDGLNKKRHACDVAIQHARRQTISGCGVMNIKSNTEIKSAALQDALALLEEAVEYLKRLPSVPATYHLIKKIESFTNDPICITARRISRDHSRETELRKSVRCASLSTQQGLPLVQIEVQEDRVRVVISKWRSAATILRRGIDLQLHSQGDSAAYSMLVTHNGQEPGQSFMRSKPMRPGSGIEDSIPY